MGFLRFLFALSIVIFHANPHFSLNLAITRLAVPSFFVMSGFAISLVLTKKYKGKNGSYWLFFTNRLLRIYPTYWFILSSLLLLSIVKNITHIGSPDNALNHLANLGKDLPFYLIANVTLLPLGPLWRGVNKNLGFLVGPQIWAIQLEILFYAIAPLLLKIRTKILIVLMAVILLLIYYFNLPLKISIPVFALFASHLVYFFLGMVSYLISQRVHPIFTYSFGNKTLDRLLGYLAYPVFISHIFFIKLAKNVIPIKDPVLFPAVVVAATVGGSYLLYKLIDEPINKLRQSRL